MLECPASSLQVGASPAGERQEVPRGRGYPDRLRAAYGGSLREGREAPIDLGGLGRR